MNFGFMKNKPFLKTKVNSKPYQMVQCFECIAYKYSYVLEWLRDTVTKKSYCIAQIFSENLFIKLFLNT